MSRTTTRMLGCVAIVSAMGLAQTAFAKGGGVGAGGGTLTAGHSALTATMHSPTASTPAPVLDPVGGPSSRGLNPPHEFPAPTGAAPRAIPTASESLPNTGSGLITPHVYPTPIPTLISRSPSKSSRIPTEGRFHVIEPRVLPQLTARIGAVTPSVQRPNDSSTRMYTP